MKFLLSIIASLFLLNTTAQQTEGYLYYDMQVSTENTANAGAMMMFGGSEYKIFFDEKHLRQEDKIGQIMQGTKIVDLDSDSILIMMASSFVEDKAFHGTIAEGINAEAENAVEVELLEETKKIKGYKCFKAVVREENGNTSTYWYTPEIKLPLNLSLYPGFSKIPGLALEFELQSTQGISMKVSLREIGKSLKKMDNPNLFDRSIPSNYSVVESMEEMGSMN